MRKFNCRIGLVFAIGLLLGACSDHAFDLGKKDLAAFKDAPPEMKKVWEEGLQASTANDYVVASTKFRLLLSQPINPEQLVALQTALGGLNNRMNAAAAKGDAAAQKALATLKEEAVRK